MAVWWEWWGGGGGEGASDEVRRGRERSSEWRPN